MIRAGALGLLLGLALLLGAGPASAHTSIVGTDPANGAQIPAGPNTVTLTFNEPIQKTGFDTVTVVGPDGNLWSTGHTAVSDNQATVSVRPLGPAGKYTIGYRITSADSHTVSGSREFTLTEPGTGTPGPPADTRAPSKAEPAAASEGGGGTPAWPFIVAAIAIFGGGIVFALRSGRSTATGRAKL